MKIAVNTVSGKGMEIQIDAADTIGVLKRAIQARTGLPCLRQRLIFAGRLLEDNRTLADYNMRKGCSVFLVTDAQDVSSESDKWWNLYASCANEIQCRLMYHDNFDYDVLHKYIHEMQKFDMSFDQEMALQGLMLGVKNIQAHRRKGSFSKELDEGLLGAIKSYEESMVVGSDSGPFIIHGNVPYLAFEEWYKRQESTWRIAFQFLDSEGGIVLLYGDPSFLHEAIAQWFGQSLIEQAALLFRGRVSNMITLMGSSQLRLPAGTHKEPDFCVQQWKSSHPIPPFVGEVAYANESLQVLKGELVQWTVDGAAKIAYGVKVSRIFDGAGVKSDEGKAVAPKVKLRFLERIQGQDSFSRDLDFSPDICTRAKDMEFQIKFPLKELFTGVTQDKRLLQGEVVFDLFELQELVLTLLENTLVNFVWHPKEEGNSEGSPLLKGVKDVP